MVEWHDRSIPVSTRQHVPDGGRFHLYSAFLQSHHHCHTKGLPHRNPNKNTGKDQRALIEDNRVHHSFPVPFTYTFITSTLHQLFQVLHTKVPSSPLTQRSQHTLSRIEERSPPISTSSNSPRPPNRSSYFAAIHPLDNTPLTGPVLASRPNPAPVREPRTMTTTESQSIPSKTFVPYSQDRSSPTSFLIDPTNQDARRLSASAVGNSRKAGTTGSQIPLPPRPKTAGASTTRSQNDQSQDYTRNFPPPTPSKPLTVPKPAMQQPTSRHHEAPPHGAIYRQMIQSTPNFSKRSSTTSQRDSMRPSTSKSASRKSSMSIGPSGVVYDSQLPDYWSSRTDLQDLSSTLGVPGSEPRASFNSTKRSGKNAEHDGERDNIIGVVTVPGKNNRVLRKKSLRKLQPQKGSPKS